MQRQFLFITTVILLISFSYSKPDRNLGNILQCIGQIGDAIKDFNYLATSITEDKNMASIIQSIQQVSNQVQPLVSKCSNPICLDDAKKRCEKSTGKTCEQYGAIMYPKCDDGFYNVGCCLCESHCPPGFRDDGLFCAKPNSYGRGAGYPWKFGDSINLQAATQRCEKDHPQGCEQNGLIIYPKCNEGYHSVACCTCSPNCPPGTTDIGVSCTKPVYGRGFGFPIRYNDCSNEPSQAETSQEFLNIETSELKNKILDNTQKFIKIKDDTEQAVKLAIEISKLMSAFEIKSTKKQKKK
ncbi:hypothetical protein ABPG74_021856 [Tetrahymena malaccensis]